MTNFDVIDFIAGRVGNTSQNGLCRGSVEMMPTSHKVRFRRRSTPLLERATLTNKSLKSLTDLQFRMVASIRSKNTVFIKNFVIGNRRLARIREIQLCSGGFCCIFASILREKTLLFLLTIQMEGSCSVRLLR